MWVYDLRTNQHFTQKQNPLRRHHLDDFVACFAPGQPRSLRVEANLDLTWLRDASLEDADNLPPPEVLAREIVDDLQAALAQVADQHARDPTAASAGSL